MVSVWHSAAAATAASLIAIPAGVATRAYDELDKESERQAADKADDGVTAADQEDAEATVVGSRGLSPMKSALLGSVANGVVHHSARPVVVIPAAV